MPNLLSRNFPEMLPDPSSPSGDSLAFKVAQSPPVSLLYNGHFAVYLFFVLSEYVLALPWHQHDKKKSPKLSPSEQLLPSHRDEYERLEKGFEEVLTSSSPAPPPIPSVARSSSAAARRSTPDEGECTAWRVIILRRLWGRF